MPCTCGHLCKCNRNCTCPVRCSSCLVCECSRCSFPFCKASLVSKEYGTKFCQCPRPQKKITRKQSATSLIAKDNASACSEKSRNYQTFKNPVSHSPYTSSKLLLNENKQLRPKDQLGTISTKGQRERSRSSSLKQKLRRDCAATCSEKSEKRGLRKDPITYLPSTSHNPLYKENEPLSFKNVHTEISMQGTPHSSHLSSLKQKIRKDDITCSEKSKKYDSVTHLPSTSCNSQFKENEPLSSKKERDEVSKQGIPHKSRLSSLMQKFGELKSRFKRSMNRKDSRCTTLAFEQEREAANELSAKTYSCNTTYSASERTKSLRDKKSSTTKNLFQLPPEVGNVSIIPSQSYQNPEWSVFAKSLSTLEDETDAFFEKQLSKPIGTFHEGKQGTGSHSSLSSKDSLFSLQPCFKPLHSKLSSRNVSRSKNVISITSSKDRQNPKSPEVMKLNTVKLNDRKNDTLMRSKSTSDDKNISPISSAYREALCSCQSQSCSSNRYARTLQTTEVSTNFELRASSYELRKPTQVAATRSKTVDLNEFPESLMASVESGISSCDEMDTTHPSYSPSRVSLHSSESCSSSMPRSLSEVPLLEEFMLLDSDNEDQNFTEAPTSNFAPSDLSENFETLDVRSPTNPTESESPFEFLSISHGRITPLMSDPGIPYRLLELIDYQRFYDDSDCDENP